MQKKLSKLLKRIEILDSEYTEKDQEITSLVFDTRKVQKGSLFFALPGTHVHGNSFIKKAIDEGAVAIVYQDELPEEASEALKNQAEKGNPVAAVHVKDSRFAMSPIADEFFDRPSSKLGIIGITGTEGKSTTVFFAWQLLRLLGKKAGFISTVDYSLGEDAIANPEHQTTPEAPIIHEKLNTMVENGCEFAVVESSSHGLSVRTNRLGDVQFDAVAMMNVTHEHLEFHGTHQQYKSDKANLFRALDKYSHKKLIKGQNVEFSPFGVVNSEDKSSDYFAQSTKFPVWGITAFGCAGLKPNTDIDSSHLAGLIEAENIKTTDRNCFAHLNMEKSSITDKTFQTDKDLNLEINLPGAFNIYNALTASILVSKLTNTDFETVLEKAKELVPVKGRMTAIRKGQPFEVIVDYAHTPSSFETIFPPLKKRCNGKLICLFGSGGERDTKKRPEQGRIASQWCNIVILADEDPRNEDPVELLEMIAAGCVEKDGTPLKRDERLYIIPDRKKAIRKAFDLAQKDDIVLLLGKAHENSIIYKDFVMPYDEISEAEKALAEMGYK